MPNEKRRTEFETEALPHMDALYNSALSLTRSGAGADDLVQETYLKAWRFFDSFKPGTSCKAWLFKIMMNTYINQYRRRARQPQSVDFHDIEGHSESRIEASVQPQSAEERIAYDGLFSDEVKAALESLPEYFRSVALLADMEGFSYQEIADMLDVPIGTVRSRLSRARGMLQKKLMDYARERGIIRDDSPEGENKDEA
jgi:RNA polymerase sigma-70 factor, ECF subfamily